MGPEGAGVATTPGWRRRRQRDGHLFFQRATGLNVLVDEIAVAPEEVDRVPRYVQWALLDACNLECSFCYASKGGARWSRERVLGLARDLDEWGVLEVALAGGEPFAYRGFEELLGHLWDTTGMAIHVTTNGLLIPEGFAERRAGRLGQVRVSVDGVGATYERLRGAPFAAVVAGLRRLRGLPVGLNLLVTDETLPEFPLYLDFAAGEGIRDLLLLRPWGPGAALLAEPWRERVAEAAGRALEGGFRVSLSCLFGDVGLPSLVPGPCGAGREYLYLGSDGRVRASSTAAEGWEFAGLEELRRLYEGPLARHVCDCAQGLQGAGPWPSSHSTASAPRPSMRFPRARESS